jgi:hypothetical protein
MAGPEARELSTALRAAGKQALRRLRHHRR